MRQISLVVLTLISGFASYGRAAEDFEALAPLVNDGTVLIARIDLARLDIDSLGKQWLMPLLQSEKQQAEFEAALREYRRWIDLLKRDRVAHFYLVATSGYPKFFVHTEDHLYRSALFSTFAVIPGASEETIEAFHKDIARESQKHPLNGNPTLVFDCQKIHGSAVIGMKPLLDELASLKPAARSEFVAALESVRSHPVQIAVVPPPIFARAAKEILLDPIPGGDSPLGQIVADGFRWAALGIDPNVETFQADLVIQSADAAAAKKLAATMKQGAYELAKDLPSTAAGIMVNVAQLLSLFPEAKANRLEWSLDAARMKALRSLVEIAYRKASADAVKKRSINNLMQIGLALANWADKSKHLPDRAIRDKDGKPLLSWRVAILPEIEEYNLYKEFHLDEPWDSEHNRKLIERMPEPYKDPRFSSMPKGYTRYLAAVGKDLAFMPEGTLKYKEFTDGTSQTIMVVEAAPERAVIWTKPDDLEVDLDHPTRGLFHDGKFLAAFADGHVETHTDAVDPKGIRAMFTRNGGEAINYEKLYPKK